MITWPVFKGAVRDADRQLGDYLHRDRRNGVRLTRDERLRLDTSAAHFHYAVNAASRISYARIFRRHLMAMVGELGTSEPVAFVTLIDGRFTLGLDVAADVDLRRLQAWVRAELPGCSFVGMTEAALYTNVGVVRAGMKRAVSWHVHLIVWGVGEERLAALIASLNTRRRTLVPGVTAGHYRILRDEEIEGQAIYMLKPPISDHRIYERRKWVSDRETGELHNEGTGRFKQRKGPLKPGHLARMNQVMADKLLDHLAFAAGDGKAVLDAINAEALAPYHALKDPPRIVALRLATEGRWR